MFLYNKQGRLVRVAFCVQYAFVMLLNNYHATVLVILAVACYFFNPSRARHIDAITEHYAELLNSDAQVVVDARSYSRVVLNHALEYNNYYVCSSSKMLGEPLSFGILGYVFVLDK